MEILSQFGFDLKLFAAQIVNFLVIAYIFKRFLYKPILTTLKKRDDAIKKGLEDAEKATKALENANVQKDEILKKASLEAERILNESKLQSQTVKEEMIVASKKEIELMMEQTKKQIELERENFRQEANVLALELSKKILETTIKDLFDEKENESLVKKGIGKISTT